LGAKAQVWSHWPNHFESTKKVAQLIEQANVNVIIYLLNAIHNKTVTGNCCKFAHCLSGPRMLQTNVNYVHCILIACNATDLFDDSWRQAEA